jgi:hypothetical protein
MIDPAGTQAAPVVTPGTPAPTGPAVKTALERAAARWGTAKLLTDAALKAAPAAAPAPEALAGAALVQAAAQVAAYAPSRPPTQRKTTRNRKNSAAST